MTPGARIERVRQLAQSQAARELLDLADELHALAQLADRVRRAQDRYWSLRRASSRTPPDQIRAALDDARDLEGELDAALARVGLGRQQLLPAGEGEG